MCLDNLERISVESLEGFKVVRKGKKAYFPCYKTGCHGLGKSVGYKKDNIETRDKVVTFGEDYPLGFHQFYTQEAAEEELRYWINHESRNSYVIVRTKASDVVAKGHHCGLPAFISKQMTILEEVTPTVVYPMPVLNRRYP